MSHTTTIRSIVISDVHALKAAIKELKTMGVNCDLLENVKPRAYSETQEGMGVAPYVVKLHNAEYDVGLYNTEDNKGLEARTDFYQGSVERELGSIDSSVDDPQQRKMGKLYQMYGVHAATRKANQQGYTVSRNTKQDGTIQLKIAV